MNCGIFLQTDKLFEWNFVKKRKQRLHADATSPLIHSILQLCLAALVSPDVKEQDVERLDADWRSAAGGRGDQNGTEDGHQGRYGGV